MSNIYDVAKRAGVSTATISRVLSRPDVVATVFAIWVQGKSDTSTSLVVNSGIRFLDQADKRSIPVVIVNRGSTRGDGRATVKIDAGTSEALSALADRLAG